MTGLHSFIDYDKSILQLPDLDEIHVWSVSLDVEDDVVYRLRYLLSAAEESRASRFRFFKDARRFVVARANLRLLLGHYLQCAPGDVKIVYGPKGKPSLCDSRSGLTFNVSHSHDLALYGIGRSRAVGIDVEYIRTDVARMEVAKRFFSEAEVEQLSRLSETERLNAFFDCWTRKEAYLKARGEGIAGGLDSFSVTCTPGTKVELLSGDDTGEWDLISLNPANKYTAAVCIEGKGTALRCMYWTQP